MGKPITTVADLVRALGGTAKAAKWAGVKPAAISQWLRRGFVPPGWHLRLLIELKRREFQIDPTLFGVSDKEAAILRNGRLGVLMSSRKGDRSAVTAPR